MIARLRYHELSPSHDPRPQPRTASWIVGTGCLKIDDQVPSGVWSRAARSRTSHTSLACIRPRFLLFLPDQVRRQPVPLTFSIVASTMFRGKSCHNLMRSLGFALATINFGIGLSRPPKRLLADFSQSQLQIRHISWLGRIHGCRPELGLARVDQGTYGSRFFSIPIWLLIEDVIPLHTEKAC